MVALAASTTPGAWQSIVTANPGAVEFVIGAGTSRGQTIALSSTNTGAIFTFTDGADVRGASILASWSGSGPWTHSFTTGFSVHGSCHPEYPMCDRRDQLFRDGVPLRQVSTTAELDFYTYHINYGTNTITVSFNPNSYLMEMADTGYFLYLSGSAADDVHVRGPGIVQFYATPNQGGAVNLRGSSLWADGWRFYDGTVYQWNNGGGLNMAARSGREGCIAEDIYVLDNGQINIVGGGPSTNLGEGIIIRRCYIERGGSWKGTSTGWEAGGTKFVNTAAMEWHRNHFKGNRGPAIWMDIDNVDTQVTWNDFFEDTAEAVKLEIGYGGLVERNVCKRVGWEGNGVIQNSTPWWFWVPAIHAQNTRNVKVRKNTLIDCARGIGGTRQNRGTGRFGQYDPGNLKAEDNDVFVPKMKNSMAGVYPFAIGVGGDYLTTEIFDGTLGPLGFQNNRYYYYESSDLQFHWDGAAKTFAQWQALGFDITGSAQAR